MFVKKASPPQISKSTKSMTVKIDQVAIAPARSCSMFSSNKILKATLITVYVAKDIYRVSVLVHAVKDFARREIRRFCQLRLL